VRKNVSLTLIMMFYIQHIGNAKRLSITCVILTLITPGNDRSCTECYRIERENDSIYVNNNVPLQHLSYVTRNTLNKNHGYLKVHNFDGTRQRQVLHKAPRYSEKKCLHSHLL
jgi:hypothetical protein